MAWKVYYDYGATCADWQPLECRTGVIAVAESDPDHNWTFWFGKDWYILDRKDNWMGTDQAGMIDQVVTRCEELLFVLQGRTLVPHARYQAIIDRMMSELKPAKTGWHPTERG